MVLKTDQPVRLARGVRARPLVQRWPALPMTLPPVTGALHLVGRQLPMLESYLSSAEIHAATADEPALYAARFVHIDPRRVGEVAELLAAMRGAQAARVALAAAVSRLDDLLRSCRGESLELLVPQVPAALRGAVELVYDREHRAGFRIHERLLYQGALNCVDLQSVVVDLPDRDHRPFTFNTPILPEPGLIEVVAPFADARFDMLFATRLAATKYGEILDATGLPDTADVQRLFNAADDAVKDVPQAAESPGGVRVRCFSHACMLVQTANASILLDPLVTTTRWDKGLFIEDLPRHIDYALITHMHPDHLCLETLLQLRHRIGTLVVPRSSGGVADPDIALMLRQCGFSNVVTMGEFDELAVGGGSVTALPFTGEHGGLDIAAKLTYLVQAGATKLLFAADTVFGDDAAGPRLRSVVGAVDALFISMECEGAPMSWLYGPVLAGDISQEHDQARRLAGSTPDQAVRLARALGCKSVFVYAMALEPWMRHVAGRDYDSHSVPMRATAEFVAAAAAEGMRAELARSGWQASW